MSRTPTRNDIRCFCAHKPLLAVFGLDESGQTYVHVRAYKQQRLLCDVVVYGGVVKIICRECLRWHRIIFVTEGRTAKLAETSMPTEIEESASR